MRALRSESEAALAYICCVWNGWTGSRGAGGEGTSGHGYDQQYTVQAPRHYLTTDRPAGTGRHNLGLFMR